ncbi:MAG: alkaline phosphatase family protein [bacterium]|nr:alkaline phosphatase family protein [bacterium]
MRKGVKTALIMGGAVAALALAVWLTGYTEAPSEPGCGYIVRGVSGEYRAVGVGETVWVFPIFGELTPYRLGKNVLSSPVQLEAADGPLTLELETELDLDPAVAPGFYGLVDGDPESGLGGLAGRLLSDTAGGFTTGELWWGRRGEFRAAAEGILRKALTDAVPGLTIHRISFPAILDGAPEPPAERRLVILGVDALDDKLLADFAAEGWLPNFSRLLDGGCLSVLRSEAPYFSPVIWTTIATGLSPAEHGLTDFTLPTDDGGRRPITAGDRLAPTFWEIVAAKGLPPITVNWFATWPAREMPVGVTLTSYAWEPRFTRVYTPLTDFTKIPRRTWPEGIMAEVDPAVASRPYIDEDDYPDAGRLETVERGSGTPLVHYLTRDALTANALLYLMGTRNWRVASCYLEAGDVACHLLWPAHALWWERLSGDPALVPPRTPEYLEKAEANGWGTLIRDFYVWADRFVGAVLEKLQPGDILIVLSDHGFASAYPPEDVPVGGGAVGRMSYWHDPTGVLILYGEGVRQGEKGPEASVYDVCPTVLALLGIPPAGDMPGRTLTGALEPVLAASLERGPLSHIVPTYGREKPTGADLTPDLSETELERLRAIGYLQ